MRGLNTLNGLIVRKVSHASKVARQYDQQSHMTARITVRNFWHDRVNTIALGWRYAAMINKGTPIAPPAMVAGQFARRELDPKWHLPVHRPETAPGDYGLGYRHTV